MPRGESSAAYNHFNKVVDAQNKTVKRKCKHCPQIFSANTSTTTLLRHYNEKHASSSSSSPSSSSSSILSVAGSEAAVERSFSAQGAVHSKRRNRLLDQVIEQEMFIRFNTTTLNMDSLRSKSLGMQYIELTEDDDYSSVEPAVGMFAFMFPASEEKQEAEEENAAIEESTQAPFVAVQMEGPLMAVDDPTERFITEYIAIHGISAGYRWVEWRLNMLEEAGRNFDPPMKDTTSELKKKIMARVNSSS
jgi:hypothetical protein